MNSRNQSQSSDQETLVRQARAGSLEAFNELVLIHQSIAYNLAYSLLGDPALAEDAAQEGFVKAFQNMNSFRGTSFRGWLLKIVTNTAYDVLRRSQRHPMQPLLPVDEEGEENDSPAWMADPAAGVQDIVEQRELSQQIYRVLDELPEAFRSVLTLIDIQDMDYTEAAQILGVPLGTVKSRLARARLQMQQRLKESMGPERGFSANEAGLAA
ncbi:MAG TPA: sigma-70 family RNA polymerase sigma factor [Anaerolineales bacterium]|nr:sigma-70 family RNA polymerase sigma factor [Anaerolineales bacterium]